MPSRIIAETVEEDASWVFPMMTSFFASFFFSARRFILRSLVVSSLCTTACPRPIAHLWNAGRDSSQSGSMKVEARGAAGVALLGIMTEPSSASSTTCASPKLCFESTVLVVEAIFFTSRDHLASDVSPTRWASSAVFTAT